MKTMIYSLTLAALMITSFSSCSDDNDPVLTQKDWDGTTTYFASADAMKFDTYYKPSVGYVGDPMPFYDPQAKDFKIMYLQEYRPNQAGTYHPIWAVSTQDAASYRSMGELISCGGLSEQDAAIGTGSTIYNPSDKLYYTFYTGNKYQPTSSENGQVVMYATSPDFKTWTKNRTFYLKGDTDGYSKNDFRDPFVFEGEDGKSINIETLNTEITNEFGLDMYDFIKAHENDSNAIIEELEKQAVNKYQVKEEEITSEKMRELERVVMLKVVDEKWMNHIDDMDELKNGIGLRAYGQQDPVVKYRMEGMDMFDEMIANMKVDVVKILMNIRRQNGEVKRQEAAKITGAALEAIESVDGGKKINTPEHSQTVVNEGPKVGRNDPCPCGSGKKYKNCCGKNQ